MRQSVRSLNNRAFRLLAAVTGPLVMFQLLSGACDKIGNLTRWVDPCGTVLADCYPGQFELAASDVPNYRLDPTCTIPGGCLGAPPSVDNPFVSPFAHLNPGSNGP